MPTQFTFEINCKNCGLNKTATVGSITQGFGLSSQNKGLSYCKDCDEFEYFKYKEDIPLKNPICSKCGKKMEIIHIYEIEDPKELKVCPRCGEKKLRWKRKDSVLF